LGAEFERDPNFRAESERLEFARALAARVIGYRSDHELSQRDLARLLGISQPQVARLAGGEHEPSETTLTRLAGALGMEFTISIAPTHRNPRLVTKRGRENAVASHEAGDAVVRYSAA
jgi:transcriptional regulator with XRE-family HTH domain